MIRRKCAEQIVGRERRRRVSQDEWSGAGCFDSRRRVSSTVGLRFVSEPGAVATGSYIQLGWNQSGVFSRPLKRALESKGDVIPGLRSHKHPTRDARAGARLTRGYHLPPLRGSLSYALAMNPCGRFA